MPPYTANWLALATVASCLSLLAYKAYTILYRRTKFHTLRGPPNPSFWLGHLKDQHASEPTFLYERWVKEYGPVLRHMGPLNSPELLTTDLRAIAHVLHHADIYEKPPTVRKALSHVLGWGVLVTEGEQHRLQRKALNPAFGAGQVRELTGIFIDKANELKEQWSNLLAAGVTDDQSGHRVDALGWYSRATLDIIGLAGFGYSFNSLSAVPGKEDEMYIAFRNLFGKPGSSLFQTLSLFFPILRSLPLAKNREIKEAMAVMRRVGTQLIRERKAAAVLEAAQGEKIEHSRARDILSLLVRANTSANSKERLTDEEVLAQIPTFLIAGHETTSTLMSWITYRLSFNPDIQSRLREECRENPLPTGIRGNGPLTSEELALFDKLPLLDAVVRETLRLHAPIAETAREATQDDVIPVSRPYLDAQRVEHNSIPIAKGDSVSIPALLIHRSTDLWGPDANEWKPERWMDECGISVAAKTIPGLYSNTLAFLGGSHACIGWKFSLYETKILLHVLVSFFEFQLAVSPDDIGGKPGIVTRPYVKSASNGGAQMPILIRKVEDDVIL